MAEPEKQKEKKEEGIMDVHLVYNIETNDFRLSAPGVPTVMLYGIIQMGLSVCIQKQVKMQLLQELAVANAQSKIKGVEPAVLKH